MIPSRQLSFLIAVFIVLLAPAYAEEAVSTSFVEPQGTLTLGRSLALALDQNPGLAPFAWDIRAAEARALQAGLRPNPELAIDLEDIRLGASDSGSTSRTAGFSPSDGFSAGTSGSSESSRNAAFGDSEITLTLSQLVELGGKRSKRVEASNKERQVAVWDYEVARADVLAQTARAFYGVVAAQEHVRLAEDLFGLAGRAHETIQTLVAAGKVSAIEVSRSQVELSQLTIERDSAERTLTAARIELSGQWGSNAPLFTRVTGTFPDTFSPPSPETMKTAIDSSPYITRWLAELEQRDAVVTLERANGKPDLTVAIGVRSAGSSGASQRGWDLSSADGFSLNRGGTDSDRDTRVVLGVSIPLPLFNRNQGRIREAEYLAEKAAFERRAMEAAISNALTAGYERASAFHAEFETLKSTVIPRAQEVFDAIQEGYRAGKFGLLDVLVAQRALFDAQRQVAQSQASFHREIVEIERFTGMPVEPVLSLQATDLVENN